MRHRENSLNKTYLRSEHVVTMYVKRSFLCSVAILILLNIVTSEAATGDDDGVYNSTSENVILSLQNITKLLNNISSDVKLLKTKNINDVLTNILQTLSDDVKLLKRQALRTKETPVNQSTHLALIVPGKCNFSSSEPEKMMTRTMYKLLEKLNEIGLEINNTSNPNLQKGFHDIKAILHSFTGYTRATRKCIRNDKCGMYDFLL